MENETLIAENVEVDMETLDCALSQHPLNRLAKAKILETIIRALSPEDRRRFEAYERGDE